MRRLALLAVLVLGLAACGGSGASTLTIQFGISGGLIVPYSVTIAPDGRVTAVNRVLLVSKQLSSAEDEQLSRDVRDAIPHLKSEQCPGGFPDEASSFITALGKTVTVRGACEPGFTKLWNELATAVGVN